MGQDRRRGSYGRLLEEVMVQPSLGGRVEIIQTKEGEGKFIPGAGNSRCKVGHNEAVAFYEEKIA